MKSNRNANAKPTVLVVPLDWGLGHATRCIPIIKSFLSAGCEVIIAAERGQCTLLEMEFPNLNFVNLRGYRLNYSSSTRLTGLKIGLQIPKILMAINIEQRWLKAFAKQKHLDVIVSDNRYGLHLKGIYSIFITHQLAIRTPFGHLINKLIRKINYAFINRFNKCWVPDTVSSINLAGELSHPSTIPSAPVQYVGILSRIKKIKESKIKNSILILISGPEPQRTIFENLLVLQLKQNNIPAIFVRGLPATTELPDSIPNVVFLNHLSSPDLEQVVNESEIIISRSGYSTIMEMLPLGKKCIFIPTPGQTEQEYLAAYLSKKNWVCTAHQDSFSLPALIKKATALDIPDLSYLTDSLLLETAISEVLHNIQKNNS